MHSGASSPFNRCPCVSLECPMRHLVRMTWSRRLFKLVKRISPTLCVLEFLMRIIYGNINAGSFPPKFLFKGPTYRKRLCYLNLDIHVWGGGACNHNCMPNNFKFHHKTTKRAFLKRFPKEASVLRINYCSIGFVKP